MGDVATEGNSPVGRLLFSTARCAFEESRSSGLERKVGGKLLVKLNNSSSLIVDKYHEGKVKRTLERVLKVPEISGREANAPSLRLMDCGIGFGGQCSAGPCAVSEDSGSMDPSACVSVGKWRQTRLQRRKVRCGGLERGMACALLAAFLCVLSLGLICMICVGRPRFLAFDCNSSEF